jgi:phosphoglycolate phosphatase
LNRPGRPAALLVDLDGTLVDSRRDIAESCNAALAAHGIAPIEPASRIVAMVGDGARALVARALAAAGSTEDVDRVRATFEAHYAAHPCEHTVLLDGAHELLACGIPCALLTNKPRVVTLGVLDALGVRDSLVDVWAADGPLKPAPDGVLALCARLGIAPRDAWVIGDGPQDVGAGKAAGAFTIAVPGLAEHSTTLSMQPDLAAGSLREIAELALTFVRP